MLDKLKNGERLQVDALNREQTQTLSTGYLLTMDNQIDQTTGTVRLKALFPNENNELFPSQFVNARLLLDIITESRWFLLLLFSEARRGHSSTG